MIFRHLLSLVLFLVSGLVVSGATRVVVTPEVPGEVPAELKISLPGIRLTQIAEHPQVVTPTGIDVDEKGRVWVVSSHTHFRPEGYPGPEHDEVVVLSPDGGRKVFYNATDATMDLELGEGGWVYLAERDRILRVRDTNGDGIGDEEQDIAVLETVADYPHNGLAGMAWDNNGDLIFSLGENFWKEWTLTARDGSAVRGTGEGGVFRCSPVGANLRRFAVGFWNPFGVCVRKDGEMFVAENDPGARPPCRLIHLVEGGDYGYQRLYGRAPFHPFVCWNGQLRSTLPMITGTGEAPCGIAPLGGGVLVPSWGDHRIDFFPLVPKGASFTSSRIEIVTGGDAFRPVCIVQADDYTYYLSDWVHGSYELHQRGRVWKLEIDPSKADWLRPSGIEPPNAARKLLKRIQAEPEKLGESRLFELAASGDAFLSRASILGLAKIHGEWSTDSIRMLSDRDRITAVLAARVSQPKDETMARSLLSDPNPDVVFEAIRWISDEDLVSLKDQIGAMFMRPNLDFQLFEASLAAWNRLNGNPRAGIEDVKLLVDRVQDETATPRLRAFALRLLPPKTKQLRIPLLRSLISLGNAELTLEAIRTLAGQESDEARRELEKLLGEPGLSDQQKAECVLGLAAVPEFHQPLLVRLAVEGKGATQREALRALRIIGVSGDARQRLRALDGLDARTAALRDAVLDPGGLLSGRPEWENEEEWSDRLAVLPGKGNASEGRRLFFHPRLALCSSCHRYEGRGKILGPELSAVAERGDHRWLLESLMQPNREVAPQFFSWTLQLKDGSDFTGITLRKGGRSGKEFYRDLTGEEQGFLKTDIVGRRENQSSLMPTGILAGLTDHEIRDLMTFLSRN